LSRFFNLIKFDPGNESHKHFVYDSFRRSINVWPFCFVPAEEMMNRLKKELATPGTETRIATPHGMDSFIGWYSTRPAENACVYGFTKYSQRRQGICLVALDEMGVDLDSPVYVKFWTPACARVSGRKLELIFDTRLGFDDA